MNKLEHLKKCKQFLRKVVNQRRWLEKNGKSRKSLTPRMQETMLLIPYHISRIVSFDKMINYIGRKDIQDRITELIPGKKEAWIQELDYLVTSGEILQGRRAIQRELSF